MKTFIDLFAGIGGFRLALESLGLKCVFSSEIDENARWTYDYNFDGKCSGDIKKIKDIPKHDLLVAGWPCQPFSVAGPRKGFEDPRGDLFFEILRVLKGCRPKAFLLENVKGLVTRANGNDFAFVLNEFANLGYYPYWKILNTCQHGNLPQNRERVFIVGITLEYLHEKIFAFPENASFAESFKFPEPIPLKKRISNLLLTSVKNEKYYKLPPKIYRREDSLKPWVFYQWRRNHLRENKSGVCPALTANMGTGGHNVPLIKTRLYGLRRLTPRECARFQGFPDSFQLRGLRDCHFYKQIGNAVSVPVVKRIAKKMLSEGWI